MADGPTTMLLGQMSDYKMGLPGKQRLEIHTIFLQLSKSITRKSQESQLWILEHDMERKMYRGGF